MTALAIAPAPIVAPGCGDGVADKYASKLVAQWLDALHAESLAVGTALHAHFLTKEGRVGGNPVSKERRATRVKRMFGSRLLASRLETGTRARVHLQLDVMFPMVGLGLKANPVERAWLAGMRMNFQRASVNSYGEDSLDFIAAISKHALIRLVQRCKCETAADLHAAFRAAWPLLSPPCQ